MNKKITTLILGCAIAGMAWADEPTPDVAVTIEIPRIDVSEYHRPYVAAWIQDEDRQAVANLNVWYQMTESSEGAGTKWLPDLRQWWRRSGRSLEMPVDGVSSATRPAGKHTLSYSSSDPRLAKLPPGEYSLVVEASREVGGRELLTLPFTWPAKDLQEEQAAGKKELGEVTLTIQPTH
ncbi:hypothetical protein CA85_35290 [Allorhodopirellula solitaria]|uniref:DUF2271 domain-containing protein n=2 Tax=Allorhodopirellula solitaria TaxID=2527987 RepID=A0A5C5XPB2_9BACT|nr:hypothetical protein CA85_35290 [Allorhodopirellula solitaria]